MTFEEYAKKRGFVLKAWQITAAGALLTVMKPWRGSGAGKTFLLRLLSDFVSEHGNCYTLESAGDDQACRNMGNCQEYGNQLREDMLAGKI